MIQAILSAILLFISSLFSFAGSSELPGSSGIAEAESSQHNTITSTPAGLVTANPQQMEFVLNSEWKSAEQPDSFQVDFWDQYLEFSCDNAGFHFESNEASEIDITWDLMSDNICFGPQSDGALIDFLQRPVTVKVDPDASATPERIYLLRDQKAIVLSR
ncbi:hypothetical protein QP999_05425 [Corynebacterium sp. MSK004]|uniref:hypothetical protein n=1 Tax=Corynebacterium sp. MSK004 TaxID=3050186 RepID=UPI00254E46E3|nr:hypothetical protein [Corynebacterium sp. MSK004]MDK8897377.1 hypothetical protein [Corynebacterium sp. MSK004]